MASNVSEAAGTQACASSGSLRASVTGSAGFSLESGCAAVSAGHSSEDFESIGLPSYQHFRPSIIRQDQYPCGSDGVALHCCFACTRPGERKGTVLMQTANTVRGKFLVI